MKKGLKLCLMYLIFLVTGLFCCTMVHALYLHIQDFVATPEGLGFSFIYIEKSFMFMCSCAVIIISPMVSYYRIRHPYGVIQTLFYIGLCLITWLVLFPVVTKVKSVVYPKLDSEERKLDLSEKVFRSVNGRVYYFLRDFHTDPLTGEDTPAIVIDTSEDGEVEYVTVKDTADFELYTEAAPYREILIKGSFPTGSIKTFINLPLIIRRGELSLQKGISFYLGFLTFAFAICSLYALTNYYHWKLISVVMIFLETVGILLFNTMYFSNFMNPIIYKLTNNGFFNFLNRFMDEPLLNLINLICGIVFITIGTVNFAVKKRKKA